MFKWAAVVSCIHSVSRPSISSGEAADRYRRAEMDMGRRPSAPSLATPGKRVIEAEVPDRGDPSSDEVGNQIVQPDLLQRDERQPVDEQPSRIDRPVQQG